MSSNELIERTAIARRKASVTCELLETRLAPDRSIIGGIPGKLNTLETKSSKPVDTQQPYRLMVETMSDGVALLTAQGFIAYCNPHFAEMLNLSARQVIGRKLCDLARTIARPALDVVLSLALEIPQRKECEFLVNGGMAVPVCISFSLLEERGFVGICVIATSLHQQKPKKQLFSESYNAADTADGVKPQIRANALSRHLSAQLMRLQDEERRRIARELHDSTGQTLSALVLKLASIKMHRPIEADGQFANALAESETLAYQALREIRDLSHLLHPPELDMMGLRAAIEWYVRRFSQITGIHVDAEICSELPRLPEDAEIALYRIVQESLSNVHRHSGSKVARVRLYREGNDIALCIRDEGRGVPCDLCNENTKDLMALGLGIRGMRERLRQLGGILKVRPGNPGTIVEATVPLDSNSSGRSTKAPFAAPIFCRNSS